MKTYRIILLLIVLTLLSGCKSKQTDTEKLNLVIGYIPHIQFTPLYVGIERGIFARHGIDLQINYGFGIDAFGLVQNGQADLALSDADQLIISSAKGAPLLSFYQYYQEYPVSVVTLSDIDTPEKLRAHTIGVPELFGTSYIGAKAFQEYFHLGEETTLTRIGYTQIPSLLSGKVNGIVCFYNNEPIQLRLKGYQINEWKINDIANLAGASFITGEKQATAKKELLKRAAQALNEAIFWTNTHQEEALTIAYKTIGNLSEDDREYWREALHKTMEIIMGKNNAPGILDPARYSYTINELYKLKLIDTRISADAILMAH